MMEINASGLDADEKFVLDELRALRSAGHGDLTIEISVKDGVLVKLWRTEKRELSALKILREGRSTNAAS